MPAFSFEAVPYRWTMREAAPSIAAEWGIDFDQALEDRADQVMQWESDWVQDHRNQLVMLDSFFSSIRSRKSLVFVYAKDLPLLEERPPGARVLLGVGWVEKVDPWVEWAYEGDERSWPLRSVLWERAVHHSIREDMSDGFLLPYHALLRDPKFRGTDLSPFIAYAPGDHFEEFSYVTERVSHDGAIAGLTELARVVDLLPGLVEGPWDRVAAWLGDRIADAWQMRGPFPGLGAVLTAIGMERGNIIAQRVVDSLPSPNDDPWPALENAITASGQESGPAAGLVGRMARRAWEYAARDSARMRFLRLIARFPLSSSQARRYVDADAMTGVRGAGLKESELVANPYLFYEADRGREDSINLFTIDRGLFPQDATAKAVLSKYSLPDPVAEVHDDRRVRAASIFVLEKAAAEGHTLLDEPTLRRRIATVPLSPECDPPSNVFALAASEFPPFLRETELKGEGRGWQMDRLADAAELITATVQERLEAGPIDANWDWRDAIDRAIGEAAGDVNDESARQEKADALRILARSRVAALVGPAGTGKTTMLRALCSHTEVSTRGVLLLAPTGKARVQLADRVGRSAMTLAQYLRKYDRWDEVRGYYTNPAAKRSALATVVVDEASMLTEEMVAALLDSLASPDRIIFCGDHRQLPPIGAGRPFSDLVGYLRGGQSEETRETGAGVAELTIGMRQYEVGRERPTTGRDDLAVASLFSVDGSNPAADEVYARVLSGDGDGTVQVVSWDDERDLRTKLVDYMATTLALPEGDADALKKSLGADGEYNGRPSFEFGRAGLGAENWQLLTPVRARDAGVDELNRLVRRTWRPGAATMATRSYKMPPPMGTDEILLFDKVMCVLNRPWQAWDVAARYKEKRDIANGEIGVAVGSAGSGRPNGLRVEFSTQPGFQFTFWASDLNGETEQGDILELAYAVTIHKSQGSQFLHTIVVIPNPCPLLSPELLYTGLTRQRNRVALFIQGDPAELRDLGLPERSETARRLTRLFRLPDPFQTPEGVLYDGAHVHRTIKGELVRSKSEVIVANALERMDIDYVYEAPLTMNDGSTRYPDFTIRRAGSRTIYWEHLGMLGSAGYRADWDAKKSWYARHDVLPWLDGGGHNGILVWSTEKPGNRGIDSQDIQARIEEVLKC